MARFKQDPSRTLTLRDKFSAEAYQRMRRLKGLIRKALVEQDVLALNTNAPSYGAAPGEKAFDFPRTDTKVQGFMEWLRRQEEDGILQIEQGDPSLPAISDHWAGTYVRRGYVQGVSRAQQQLKKEGMQITPIEEQTGMTGEPQPLGTAISMSAPMHADRLGLVWTRTFNELKGITEAMDQQISRELAEGMALGENPYTIARRLNDRVDKIGITRSRLLARTEVIRAHAEAQLSEYERQGVEEAIGDVEFSTAGDSRVCPRCKALQGREFTTQEARGLIPVHPRCRCAWIPVIRDEAGQPIGQGAAAKQKQVS